VLADVDVADIRRYEDGLYTFLDTDPDGMAAMKIIRETGALSEEAEGHLKAALAAYTSRYVK